MTPTQLESWVLATIDQIQGGHPVEDARIEIKGSWIEPRAAARRIAGHANASRGDHALWIIGIDETTGSVAGKKNELARWWPQVEAEFEGGAPSVLDLWVAVGESGVTALLFDTSRAPFVVRNPVRNQNGAGPVELEVPWREGTRTRSARRADLVRLLLPIQSLPLVEVLGAGAAAIPSEGMDRLATLQVRVALYIVPQTDSPLVLPFHRCKAALRSAGLILKPTPPDRIELMPEYTLRQRRDQQFDRINNSLTVAGTNREVLVRGAGVVEAVLTMAIERRKMRSLKPLKVELILLPAGAERAVEVETSLDPVKPARDEVVYSWALKSPGIPGLFADISLSSGWRLRSQGQGGTGA